MGYEDCQLETDTNKIYASEAACFVVDEMIQIFEKNEYLTDASIQKISRHIRIFTTFEGTNDKLRLAITVAGLEYAYGLSKDLQKAMNNSVVD